MEPARRLPLGRTRALVTQLSVGTVPIGGMFEAVDEETAQATLERAWEAGVRSFDTAPLYGYGVAEKRLGRFLRQQPRVEYVISTKVGRLLEPGPDPAASRDPGVGLFKGVPDVHPVFDFSYDAAMRSVEASLERLGLDRVDVLRIHDPDDYMDEAIDGACRALAKLKCEGTVQAIGAGMNDAALLARLARSADFDCFLVAGRYTLLDQRALPELLPLCVEKNISVIIGGVYNSGILTNPRAGATFNYRPAEPAWLERAQRIQRVCDRHAVPLMAAAIQFPLAHPAVATVLTGVRSPAEMEENERMFRRPIPAALWQELRHQNLLPEEAPLPQA